MHEFANGEHYLLSFAPAYKRRYTVDGDLLIGCPIGCQFCYYRWIDTTADLIGTGRFRPVGDMEAIVAYWTTSKLIRRDKDLLVLCARSDGSVQLGLVAEFAARFPWRNRILLLHRGYAGPRQAELLRHDARFVFATTLTPLGPELGWTPIRTDRQLEGIAFLLSQGVPPDRISVEIGPLNRVNLDKGLEILRALAALGLPFATYRGVSFGTFFREGGAEKARAEEHRLRQLRFLDGTEAVGDLPAGHDYYVRKNVLAPDLEQRLEQCAAELGIRLHRFTGTLYQSWGYQVAYNRGNRYRPALGQPKHPDPNRVGEYLSWLGYTVLSVQPTVHGVHVETQEVVTEDVAMTVGAEFETCVTFSRYRLAPTMEDLAFYRKNCLFNLAAVGL